MRGNNLIWLSLAIVIVGATAAAGYVLSLKTAVSFPQSAKLSDPAAPAGVRLVPPGGPKIDSVTGTIASLDDSQRLLIKDARVSADAREPQGPTQRSILITSETAIVAAVPLTAKESASAAKKYQSAIKAGKNEPPPTQYKEISLVPADLRLTMNVTVISDEDIRNAETIKAKKISFLAPPSLAAIGNGGAK
jgi:hypothetical protein